MHFHFNNDIYVYLYIDGCARAIPRCLDLFRCNSVFYTRARTEWEEVTTPSDSSTPRGRATRSSRSSAQAASIVAELKNVTRNCIYEIVKIKLQVECVYWIWVSSSKGAWRKPGLFPEGVKECQIYDASDVETDQSRSRRSYEGAMSSMRIN